MNPKSVDRQVSDEPCDQQRSLSWRETAFVAMGEYRCGVVALLLSCVNSFRRNLDASVKHFGNEPLTSLRL
jgi:hypothetical protein